MSRNQGGKESVHPRGGIRVTRIFVCLDNIAGTLSISLCILVLPCQRTCESNVACFFLSLTLTAFSLMKLSHIPMPQSSKEARRRLSPMTYRRRKHSSIVLNSTSYALCDFSQKKGTWALSRQDHIDF